VIAESPGVIGVFPLRPCLGIGLTFKNPGQGPAQACLKGVENPAVFADQPITISQCDKLPVESMKIMWQKTSEPNNRHALDGSI
jgi:hypothetical protein